MIGNKGEWSELYTFLKLLSQGRIYAANENVGQIKDVFFPILKIIREEIKDNPIEYAVCNDNISILIDKKLVDSVPKDDFNTHAKLLLEGIVKNSGSFEIKEIENFANGILVTKLKAPSTDKSDITLQISDFHTNLISTVGFSIKSELGNPPTLLNAGKTTNFIFKVSGLKREQLSRINNINTKQKINDRMKTIREYGGTLRYVGMKNETFQNNLIMIDSFMPQIIGNILLYHYFETDQKLQSCKDIIKFIEKIDPLGYDSANHMYEYKFKKFLCSCALGMKPSTSWDGIDEANGGYIVVKANGEVLAYHIYNRNKFEDYLLNSTILERASTTRHDYLNLYESNGEIYIKLNLQIRFKI